MTKEEAIEIIERYKIVNASSLYDIDTNKALDMAIEALKEIDSLKGEIDLLKAEKRKEEIKVGDEVASINPATGELNLWNTFIVTEIGEDFIGGINSKGETHFHDEPRIFNIWVKTGKHIDILRVFDSVESASQKAGEQE